MSLEALQTQLNVKQKELDALRTTAKSNEDQAKTTVQQLVDTHKSEITTRDAQLAKQQQEIADLQKLLSLKTPPSNPTGSSTSGLPATEAPTSVQTEATLANSLAILRNQVISLADPAKKEEMLQQNALSVMTLQDSDDMYRVTAKVGKNKKFELPLSLNPALTDVQENPYLLPLILHPLAEFDHDAAQQKAATVTLGLSGRYHVHSSSIVAEVTNLITGMPLTLKLLAQAKATAKGIFESLLPTLEAIKAKISIMQKRDNDRKTGRGGGRGGRGAGGRRGGLRGGRFGAQQYGSHPYQHPSNRYNYNHYGAQQGEGGEQDEQEALEPVAKRPKAIPRGRGRTAQR